MNRKLKKCLSLKTKNYSLRCNSKAFLRKPERSQRHLWEDVFNQSLRIRFRDLQISPVWDVSEIMYERRLKDASRRCIPSGSCLNLDFTIAVSDAPTIKCQKHGIHSIDNAKYLKRSSLGRQSAFERLRKRFVSEFQQWSFYLEIKQSARHKE